MDQILSKFWQFWCRWKAGDEIYPNLAKLNWEDIQILQIEKFGFRVKDPKFGFDLGLRISNFQFWPKISKFDQKSKFRHGKQKQSLPKLTSTRRSKVTLLRRVDVIFPNSKFRNYYNKIQNFTKKSNFVTKFFLGHGRNYLSAQQPFGVPWRFVDLKILLFNYFSILCVKFNSLISFSSFLILKCNLTISAQFGIFGNYSLAQIWNILYLSSFKNTALNWYRVLVWRSGLNCRKKCDVRKNVLLWPTSNFVFRKLKISNFTIIILSSISFSIQY